MSQGTRSLWSVLSFSWAYAAWGRLVGSKRGTPLLHSQHFKVGPEDRVLDLGCGPAAVLEHITPWSYLGVDPSEKYIETARQRFGDKGVFVVGTADTIDMAQIADRFDLVLAIGVLHHIDDDQAERLVACARHALVKGGRFVTVDCVAGARNPIARLLIRADRGRNVRSADEIRRLLESSFDRPQVGVRHDLLRVPYSHVYSECRA